MSGARGVDAIGSDEEGWHGYSALEERLDLLAERTPGIRWGCKIDPDQSGLRYYYHEGGVSCSRGDADGLTSGVQGGGVLTHTDGGALIAPGGGLPRVDTIYAIQLNPEHGDATNDLVVRVRSGVPASSPTWPVLPVGAVELGSYRINAGASATGQSTAFSTGKRSVLRDASSGMLFEKSDPNNGSYGTSVGTWISGEFVVETRRRIEVRASVKIKVVKGTSGEDPEELRMLLRPRVDGTIFAEEILGPWNSLNEDWYTHDISWYRVVNAGRHTVALDYGRSWGNAIPHGVYNGGLRRGTTLSVLDAGVVA